MKRRWRDFFTNAKQDSSIHLFDTTRPGVTCNLPDDFRILKHESDWPFLRGCRYLFVIDKQCQFKFCVDRANIHHHDLNANKPVLSAGTLSVDTAGRLSVDNKSGSYVPADQSALLKVIDVLYDYGLIRSDDINRVELHHYKKVLVRPVSFWSEAQFKKKYTISNITADVDKRIRDKDLNNKVVGRQSNVALPLSRL